MARGTRAGRCRIQDDAAAAGCRGVVGMIQLRASGLIADAVDVEQRRREFHEVGWTRFPALLEPRLLQCVQEGLDHNPWDDYFKAGFDSNEILTPSPPLRLLQFVTNWPSFLAL